MPSDFAFEGTTVSIQYFVEHLATAVAAISGSRAARGKQIDLFGILVLALVTAVGGGTLRDVILDPRHVFWVEDASYVITSSVAALLLFIAARFWRIPEKFLLFADAGSLALFTALGVNKALAIAGSPVVAVTMGVMTGVAGGMIRDVLTGEIPLVFRRQINLYATASLCGATVFAVLHHRIESSIVWSLAIATTLLLRLAAIQWEIRLPLFIAK